MVSGEGKIRTLQKKYVISGILIAVFGVQLLVIIGQSLASTDRIEGLNFTTDDAYANYINSQDPNALKRFFKTDNIAINFIYNHSGHLKETQSYWVTIKDPSGNEVSNLNFNSQDAGDTIVNLTDVLIDPNKFQQVGQYEIKISVIKEFLGWLRVITTNVSHFIVERAVVDIGAWYTDKIYLETGSTSYHHQLEIYGQVQDAGYGRNIANLSLNVYWFEPNGEFDLIVSTISNTSGQIFVNTSREYTVSQNQMKLKITTSGNDVYSNATSESKTSLWKGNENIRHILMNAGENIANPFDAYTDGSPLTLELTNIDHNIYSPKAGNAGIEDFNYTTDPFTYTNSYGYTTNESKYDGWDYQIQHNGVEVSNNYQYPSVGPTPFMLADKIYPIGVSLQAGLVQAGYDLITLTNTDDSGIFVTCENITSGVQNVITPISGIDLTFLFFFGDYPLEQIANVNLTFNLSLGSAQSFNSAQIYFTDKDGMEKLVLSDVISNQIMYGGTISLPLNKLNLEKTLFMRLFLLLPTNALLPVLIDQFVLNCSITNLATRKITWDSTENNVNFIALGGTALDPNTPDISCIRFGTEIKIPTIPYYSLQSVVASISFTLDYTQNFQKPSAEFWLEITSVDGKKEIPLKDAKDMAIPYGHFDLTQNISTCLPNSTADKLIYFTLIFKTDKLNRGDQAIVRLEQVVLRGLYTRDNSSFSNIETYQKEAVNTEPRISPISLDHTIQDEQLTESRIITNGQVPYYSGPRSFDFNLNTTYPYSGNYAHSGNWQLTSIPTTNFPDRNVSISSLRNATPSFVDDITLLQSLDDSYYEFLFSQVTNYEYLSTDFTIFKGREYTIVTDGSSVFGKDFTFELGNGRESLITIPISENYNGLIGAKIYISVLRNESNIGTYDIMYRSVVTPGSWMESEIINLYHNLDEGSEIWCGPRHDLLDYQLLSGSNFTTLLLDITSEFRTAIQQNKQDITFLFKTSGDVPENVIKTSDTLFAFRQGNPTPTSFNTLRISSFGPADLTFQITDNSFVLTQQMLEIDFKTDKAEVEIYYYNEAEEFQLLGNLPATNTIKQQAIFELTPGFQLINGRLSLLFHPVFNENLQTTDQPLFGIDFMGITHYNFSAMFFVEIPKSAENPYSFGLGGLPIPILLTYGNVWLVKGEDRIGLWNIASRDYTQIGQSTFSRLWAIDNDNSQIFQILIEFISSGPITIEFSWFDLRVASVDWEFRNPAGLSASEFFDFDSSVQFDKLLVTWQSHNEGSITIRYGWGSTLAASPTYGVLTIINAGDDNPFELLLMDGTNPVQGRYLVIEYTLNINPGTNATFGPLLQNLTVYATRKLIGNLQSFLLQNDGNELIFSNKNSSTAAIYVNFTLDPNRRSEPLLVMSADYFEYGKIGTLATQFLDNYSVAIYDVLMGIWVDLHLEKRAEDLIDAKLITNLTQFEQSTGIVQLRYLYQANHFVNVHIDYLGLIYYSNISYLLDSPYYYHMDLPRGSQIVNIFPTSVAENPTVLGWESTNADDGQYDQTIINTDPATGRPKGISLLRTLTEYASGNKNSFSLVTDAETVTTDYLKGHESFLHTVLGYQYDIYAGGADGNHIPAQMYTCSIPCDVDAGQYQVQLSVQFAVIRELSWEFFWTRWYWYDTSGSVFVSLVDTTRPTPENPGWETEFDLPETTVTVFERAGQPNYFNLYYWMKYPMNWWEALYYNKQVKCSTFVDYYKFKMIPSQEGSVKQTISKIVEIPVKAADPNELRGALLSGNITWDGFEYGDTNRVDLIYDGAHNLAQIAYEFRIATEFNQGSVPTEWEALRFTNTPNWESGVVPLESVGYQLSNHPDQYIFPYNENEGSFLDKDCILNGGLEKGLIIRIFVSITYRRANPLLQNFNWNIYRHASDMNVGLGLSIGINALAIPLLDNDAFSGKRSLDSFDFGATFDVNVADLKKPPFYDITSENAWFFATHIKYAITPSWSNAPFRFDTFGGTLYYSFHLAMQKYVNGVKQWVEFNPDKFAQERILTPSQGQDEYQLILAESEDRASSTDLNALRLGARDLADYFMDGNTLRFMITLTVRFNDVTTFDRQSSNWQSNPHKQIAVNFECYTTIDYIINITEHDCFQTISEQIPIPLPQNPELAGKISFVNINFAGTISLLSAELFHIAASGIGLRIGIDTPESGHQIFAQYILSQNSSAHFSDILTIPHSKLRGLNTIPLFIEIGFWNGKFVGVYNDVGILKVSLDYLRFDFVYSTGFLDVAAGRAYVDQVLDLNFGTPIPNNVTSIIVTTDIDSVIQGLWNVNGRLQQKVSYAIPYIKIYNWITGNYDFMSVFALGGTAYQFVLDSQIGNPLEYSSNGRVRLLVVLDGRSQVQEVNSPDTMYYASLTIKSMECEFAVLNQYQEPGTYNKIKSTGDILIDDPWQVPALLFRKDLYLEDAIPNEPFKIQVVLNFTSDISSGMYPYNIQVIGQNSTQFDEHLVITQWNGSFITQAILEAYILGPENLVTLKGGGQGVRVYWNSYESGIPFINTTFNATTYTGHLHEGTVESYYGNLPYLVTSSENLGSTWNLDFSLYRLNSTTAYLEQEFLFETKGQFVFPPCSLTSYNIQFMASSQLSLAWKIGFYNVRDKQFVYYNVPDFSAQQIYFPMTQSRFYILPFQGSDFWEYCSDIGQILIRFQISSNENTPLDLNLNLLELQLNYNESNEALANQTFLNYIIDEDFLASLKYWDTFDDSNLGTRYVGDVTDFGAEQGSLTKTADYHGHTYKWESYCWLPRFAPSYLLINATETFGDYYANFRFNIQPTARSYETVTWLTQANTYHDRWVGQQITGVMFRIHAQESHSFHANMLEVWVKKNDHAIWRLFDTVALPTSVHAGQWYDVTTYVNGSHFELWLNKTHFYTRDIPLDTPTGYFGFYSYYTREFLIGDVVLTSSFWTDGSFADHFASINVQMPTSGDLQYGDQVNASIEPYLGYGGSLLNQKVNFMVNSSDGWLTFAEGLTNETGQVAFPINRVDLYTKDILGDVYPRIKELELVSNTTIPYASESFNGHYDLSWVSNYPSDYSTANGYLEKVGSHWKAYMLTNLPQLPSNFTFDFQAYINPSAQHTKAFEWLVDSNGNAANAYLYRLYSSIDSGYPNVLRIYEISSGSSVLLDQVEVPIDIFAGMWHDVSVHIAQDSNFVYHEIYLNDEQIYACNFSTATYSHGSYVGFRVDDAGQCWYDNVSLYSGSVEWREIMSNPFRWDANATVSQFQQVKYAVDGITRVDNIMVVQKPFITNSENVVSLQLNVTFPDLLNEHGEKFNLQNYYGIRVGILIPYDEIAQSVTVYVLDASGNRYEVILEGTSLSSLYDNPDARAVFINGSRLIHTFIDIGLKNTFYGNLDTVQILGVEVRRKVFEVGPYQGRFLPNIVGIASMHFITQLNNFSYDNYGFADEPESQIAIWYQGEGRFYSSWKVIPHVFFRRIPVIISFENAADPFAINFGQALKVSIDLTYSAQYVPILSLVTLASFLLFIEQSNKRVVAGFEVVSKQLYELQYYHNYTFDVRTIIGAGVYPSAGIRWMGNGLFKNASAVFPVPLTIVPTPSTTEVITNNLGFNYGNPASIEGIVYDSAHEMLKDGENYAYLQDFEDSSEIQKEWNSGIPPSFNLSSACMINGTFNNGEWVRIYEFNVETWQFPSTFVNLFKFNYWTSTSNITFDATIWYKIPGIPDYVERTRSFSPSATNAQVTVFMDTQFEEDLPAGSLGTPILAGWGLKFTAIGAMSELVQATFSEVQFLHDPLVYLQVRRSDGDSWHNLTVAVVENSRQTESKFSVPLFTNGIQFLLNNPYEGWGDTPSLNGQLEAGDYQVRLWYAGDSQYYQPSWTNAFVRVNAIPTAIFYVPDNTTGPTRDGYYAKRSYDSTTVFALEAGKPFTLLDVGYTWGDVKNLTFLLSTSDGGFNGIPGKPVWFQVGIVPSTIQGLRGRDYFADYYPVVRNVVSGELVSQPFIVQEKWGRALIYDYYDVEAKQVRYFGPYLWMVGFTDSNGLVTFPLNFGPSLMEDLLMTFPGTQVNNIAKDLYIRVFYSSSFGWDEMALTLADEDLDIPYLCTSGEHARFNTHIFTQTDAFALQTMGQPTHYQDGIYASSYAEGILHARLKDLNVTGQYFEVSNTGGEGDIIPLLAYIKGSKTTSEGQTIQEPLKLDEFNRLDEIWAYFVIMDPLNGATMLGDPQKPDQFLINIHPDNATGRIYVELDAAKIIKLVPGYYDVWVYIPQSEYYQAATTSFRMLLKSQYTYEFTQPSTLTDFNYQLDKVGRAFAYNVTSMTDEYNYVPDFIAPILKGSVWMEADPNPSLISDGVGVTITLNNVPIFDQIVKPAAGPISFGVTLEYFEGIPLKLNISTWTDEFSIGRDVEYPFYGNNIAEWVHINASIYEPTYADPTNGLKVCDIIDQYYDLITQPDVVQFNNVYLDDTHAVQVRSSTPFGSSYQVPGLLVYPTDEGYEPSSVQILIPYIPIKSPLALLDTNSIPTDFEQLYAGRVQAGGNFGTGIRRALVANPLDLSATPATIGAIVINSTQTRVGVNYTKVYTPYKGVFEALVYVPTLPTSGTGTYVQCAAKVNGQNLAQVSFTNGNKKFQKIRVPIPAEFYSTINNFTLEVSSTGMIPLPVYWIQANLTGMEDVLYVGTELPFGRAALFSSNFLYYYVGNASNVGLHDDQSERVWLRVENTPGKEGAPAPYYDLATRIMKIYEQTGPDTMSRFWQTLDLSDEKSYTFTPHTGIFIRNRFTDMSSITVPELHAGYYSMYGSNIDGNLDANNLLGRRKVSIVVNPQSYDTYPTERSLEWLTNSYALYSAPVKMTDFDRNANRTTAEIYFTQDPYPSDLVYQNWNASSFKQHWNKTSSSSMDFDYWYNEIVYTTAKFSTNNPMGSENKLDFYPDPSALAVSTWVPFKELILNLAVNNSYLINTFEVILYGSTGILRVQNFMVTSNATQNYAMNLTGVDLTNVVGLDLICKANESRLTSVEQQIFFSSGGIALPDPSKQVKVGVKYQDGSSFESSPISRAYFGSTGPFIFDLFVTPSSKEISNIYFNGTNGAHINLDQMVLIQYPHGTEDVQDATSVMIVYNFAFDISAQRNENILRFLSAEPSYEDSWQVENGIPNSDITVLNITNPFTRIRYTDTNFDGFYDQVERWEDLGKQGFDSEDGVLYSIDLQNRGVWDVTVYTDKIVQEQFVEGEPTKGIITQIRKTKTITSTFGIGSSSVTTIQEFGTFQTRQVSGGRGTWLPETRTRTTRVCIGTDQKPVTIIQDIDEWRPKLGEEGYQAHRVSQWNETRQDYDVTEWHDWAVTLNVVFLGETETTMENVTGVLDRGVDEIDLDPTAPILDKTAPGTILWVCSYAPKAKLAPFYDVGLVILNSTSWSYSYTFNSETKQKNIGEKVREGYALCVGIVLDLNRDHIWQKESPGQADNGAIGDPYDSYAPLWEVSTMGRYLLRQVAEDQAWQGWLDQNSKAQGIVSIVASVAVSVIVAIAAMAVASYFCPALTLLATTVAGFVGGLVASLIMQYIVNPAISMIFDPAGYEKNERVKANQNVLMNTQVPSPVSIPSLADKDGAVTPGAVFDHYKALYKGYEVPLMLGTTDVVSSRFQQEPHLFQGDDRVTIINARIWVFDQEANEFLDNGDWFGIVWSYITNPFGLFSSGGTNIVIEGLAEYDYATARYKTFCTQRETIARAYANVLELPSGVSVVIYPSRVKGSPEYIVAVDDSRGFPCSNFWNFSDPIVQIADKNMVIYAAKYLNFAALDWRTAAAGIAISIAQMIATMGLAKMGTNFLLGKTGAIFGDTIGKAFINIFGKGFLVNCIIENYWGQSLGAFVEDLVMTTPARETLDRLPPGWKLRDIVALGWSIFTNRLEYAYDKAKAKANAERARAEAETAAEEDSLPTKKEIGATEECSERLSEGVNRPKNYETKRELETMDNGREAAKKLIDAVTNKLTTTDLNLADGVTKEQAIAKIKDFIENKVAEGKAGSLRETASLLRDAMTTEIGAVLKKGIHFDPEITLESGERVKFYTETGEIEVRIPADKGDVLLFGDDAADFASDHGLSLDTDLAKIFLRSDVNGVNMIDPYPEAIDQKNKLNAMLSDSLKVINDLIQEFENVESRLDKTTIRNGRPVYDADVIEFRDTLSAELEAAYKDFKNLAFDKIPEGERPLTYAQFQRLSQYGIPGVEIGELLISLRNSRVASILDLSIGAEGRKACGYGNPFCTKPGGPGYVSFDVGGKVPHAFEIQNQKYDPISGTWEKVGSVEFKNVQSLTEKTIEEHMSSEFGKIKSNHWNARATLIFDPVHGGGPDFYSEWDLRDPLEVKALGTYIGKRVMLHIEKLWQDFAGETNYGFDTGYKPIDVIIFARDFIYTGHWTYNSQTHEWLFSFDTVTRWTPYNG